MNEYAFDDSIEIPFENLEPGFLLDSLQYWRSLKEKRFAPSWNAFDLMALPPEAIPFSVVVDVIPKPLGFIYRYWGTGHVTAKGIERTGQSVIDLPQGRGEVVFSEYRQVMEQKRPAMFNRKVALPGNKPTLDQTALRMPLTLDGKTVDKIISVSDWLSVRKHWKDLSGESSPSGSTF